MSRVKGTPCIQVNTYSTKALLKKLILLRNNAIMETGGYSKIKMDTPEISSFYIVNPDVVLREETY